MTFPKDLKYLDSHEWARLEGSDAVVGISDFAQEALGDIVFVNLPAVGDSVTAGQAFGDVESVKAVSDMLCPVSGTVAAVNDAVDADPAALNSDPYGTWLIKVSGAVPAPGLMDSAAYEAYCNKEH